jgi:hypothetical protein
MRAKTKKWFFLGSLICAASLGFSKSAVTAGEVGSGIGACDTTAIPVLQCEWRPKGCYKPSRPYFNVTTASDYNTAVYEFNSYLDALGRYESCVLSDAKNDVGDRFPSLVKKGLQKEEEEMNNDLERAKEDLSLAKSNLHR